jgi:hypothetical protein
MNDTSIIEKWHLRVKGKASLPELLYLQSDSRDGYGLFHAPLSYGRKGSCRFSGARPGRENYAISLSAAHTG